MRSGRPWGPLKGVDPALHDLARYLRGVVDESTLTSKEVGSRCGCSDSTVSKRLGGDQLPEWQFVVAVIDACTVGEHRAEDRKRAVRAAWDRAAHSLYRRPSGSSDDPRAMILEAQAETISAQRQLLKVTEELSRAHKQLAKCAQVEFQASQVILVLQIVLTRLSRLISGLTRDRDRYRAEAAGFREELEAAQGRLDNAERERGRAETQLGQAKEERRRASVLTEESRAKIRLLETRLVDADEPEALDGVEIAGLVTEPMAPSPDDMLLDMTAGLDRVQRLLDEQDSDLSRLEAERPTVESAADDVLSDAGARYRSAFADSMTGIAILDLEGRILEVNPALQKMIAFDEDELCEHDVRDFVSPVGAGDWRFHLDLIGEEVDQFRFEGVIHRADGENVRTRCTLSLARDDRGEPQYQVATFEDVSEQYLVQSRLRYQVLHDWLTGLPNRAAFLDRLRGVVGEGGGRGRVAICYLGIDGFKVVNESLGHDIGDQVLVEVGRRLHHSVAGAGRHVAHMGSDEFAILVEGSKEAQNAVDVVERVMQELEPPVLIGDHALSVSVSAGIVERSIQSGTASDLMREADIALRWAKDDGKARWALYDAERDARDVARFTMSARMSLALELDEFYVMYQPLARFDNSAVVGVEALIFWEHPDFGVLGRDRFIELAEETGLALKLDRWLLRTACRDARWWRGMFGDAAPVVSVNISARMLRDPSLVRDVARILSESHLPDQHLQLEFTEDAVTSAADVSLHYLRALSDRGIRLAIDDFGTGYSSREFLRRLPVREVKISELLVHSLCSTSDERPADASIVSALVEFAHSMSLAVTAVGVDTPSQAVRLQDIGCEFGQGEFFGPPLNSEGVAWLLRTGLGLTCTKLE